MTREELRALVADILNIHACPCCLDSMPGRADTILLAADQYAAEGAAHDDHLQLPGLRSGPDR